MKKNLLFILLTIFTSTTTFAHFGSDGMFENYSNVEWCFNVDGFDGIDGDGKKISVYPNPATDYFMLKNSENINMVIIYNIVGRQMKSYKVNSTNDRFVVSDLPKGMYVIRLTDQNNKILQTLRMNKR